MTTRPNFSVPLKEIESCFRGVAPSFLATVSAEGIPNITTLSIVHLIDDEHVGLTRQFFNKTIANLQANGLGQIDVLHPTNGQTYRLDLKYDHTETEGGIFDRVKARLDVVASLTGMKNVFKLAAVDVCRVLECKGIVGDFEPEPPSRSATDLVAVEEVSRRVAFAPDMDSLITAVLQSLSEKLGYEYSSLLLLNETGDRLYTVASHGFETSGVGSEVCVGVGLAGVAAERLQLVNLANVPGDLQYTINVRSSMEREGVPIDLESDIPLPGIPNAVSQMAVPIVSMSRLKGVLLLQSPQPSRFQSNDEALLSLLAREVGLAMMMLGFETPQQTVVAEVAPNSGAQAVQVKHYAEDDSIFIDNEYVIKGVAGRVLWRLLQSYSEERRVDFTNKEIRLDPSLDLPDIKDNLEARLILLRRRLEGRCDDFVQITSGGRGRIRLNVKREFSLREVEGG